MMKLTVRFIASVLVCLAAIESAHAARFEIATLAGRPDSSLDFVSATVVSKAVSNVRLDRPEDWYTTILAYLLVQKGVRSAVNFEVMDWDGTSSIFWINDVLREAAVAAPVVIHDFTPEVESTCKVMAEYPQTAFVISAGEGGSVARVPGGCHLPNILRVAGLNSELTGLLWSSNFGQNVGIAAPAQSVEVIALAGERRRVTGVSYGAAAVGGALAAYAARNPELSGAGLVERFLEVKTHKLAGLEGKVSGARALLP